MHQTVTNPFNILWAWLAFLNSSIFDYYHLEKLSATFLAVGVVYLIVIIYDIGIRRYLAYICDPKIILRRDSHGPALHRYLHEYNFMQRVVRMSLHNRSFFRANQLGLIMDLQHYRRLLKLSK